MPAALERALKRRAAKLGLGKERRDAYVYGTLRKTGWKPSHQMNTDERAVRLAAIDKKLESLVQFQYDDPDDQRRFPYGKTAAVGGAVGGGYLLNRAVQRTGGWGANLAAGRTAFADRLAGQLRFPGGGPGAAVGSTLARGAKTISPALAKLKGLVKPVLARVGLESKEKPIRLDETLLQPFQGDAFESKISQEQFPAGLSPAAALRMPFPELMKLLQRKQILRQVFSEKHGRLVELNDKLDAIYFREDRSGKTIKGGLAVAGGAAGVYGGYKGIQALKPVARYKAGEAAAIKAGARSIVSGKLAKIRDIPGYYGRMSRAFYKGARHARLSAKIDGLIELEFPEKLKQKIKEKVDKAKGKKKGHQSHGGGT